MPDPVLSLRGVTKHFGSFVALSDVSLDFYPGEVHALLGVNGAGKSTLVKILSGVVTKTAGLITLAGQEIELGSPQAALGAGIAVVQQHTELVPRLTGYENIYLGKEQPGRSLLRRIDRRQLHRRAKMLLRRFPMEIDLSRLAADMSSVEREVVAILQALSSESMSVLILDEPTSILTEHEKQALFQLIETLRTTGISIVYITHRLEEVFEIGQRLTVLRNGQNIASLPVEEVKLRRISIPELMLGRQLGHIFPEKSSGVAETVLSCTSLTCHGYFSGIDLLCRKGEIVGIFGLVGSGLDELSKALFGIIKPTSGSIQLENMEVHLSGPDVALAKGIFLVPGDRRTEGLTASRDTVFNATIANLDRACSFGGLFQTRRAEDEIGHLANQVELYPMDLARPVSAFSGGNQQKIVIAKGLFSNAKLYIFAEPTIGVDIGARKTIYALMRELSKSAGVLVMSSDIDEIHGLSDRLYTIYKGRVVLDGHCSSLAREDVLAAGLAGEIRHAA